MQYDASADGPGDRMPSGHSGPTDPSIEVVAPVMRRRVQLRRTKGYRKPVEAIVVNRTTPWGNPFTVNRGPGTTTSAARTIAAQLYAEWITGTAPWMKDTYTIKARTFDRRWVREHLYELTDRVLACNCPIEDNCHADVLHALARERRPAAQS